MTDRLLAWVRIGFAVLVVSALVTQIANLLANGLVTTAGPALRERRREA